MGISDDIRPKKHEKSKQINEEIVEQETVEDDKPVLEEGEEEVLIHRKVEKAPDHFFENEETEEKADDFFADLYKKPEIEEEEKPSRPKRAKSGLGLKIIIIALTILLVIILIKQNLSSIYEYLGINDLIGNNNVAETNSNPYENLDTDYTNNTAATTGTSPTATTDTTSSSTASSGATSGATTTATSSLNKSSITVSVLNGNGVKGSASAVKTTLQSSGYTISNLGNARVFSYTNTKVYYKTGKSLHASDIKSTLSDRTVGIEESNVIAGSYDLVVVVGAN